MREREHQPARTPPASGRGAASPAALPAQIGNRAMGRMLARMETAEAVAALGESLASGVTGAEQRVVDTMTAYSADASGFDQVHTGFEQQAKTPLLPELQRVPGAAEHVPEGWYPGIGGQGG